MSIRIALSLLACWLIAGCASSPAWVRHDDQARALRLAGRLAEAEREAARALETGAEAFEADGCAEARARLLRAELAADLGVVPGPDVFERVQAGLERGACAQRLGGQALLARLSGLALLAGRFDLARRLADRAAAGLGRALTAPAPTAPAPTERASRAEALAGLAALPLVLGELDLAAKRMLAALDLWAQGPPPDPLELGAARVSLGRIRTRQNRLVEAAGVLERAYADMVAAVGPDHPCLIGALLAQVRLMVAQGELAAAEVPLDRARRIVDASFAADHPRFADLLITQADLLAQRGDPDGAAVLVQRALDVLAHRLGEQHPLLAAPLFQLAALHHLRGRPAEARPLLERALGLWRRAAGEDNPATLKIKLALGMVHLQAGEALRAELLARDVAERLERVPDLAPIDRQACFELLGQATFAQRKIGAAWRAYQRLVHLTQAGGAGPSLELARALESLAGVAGAGGHPEEAVAPLERAVAIRRKIQGPDHLQLGRSLVMLSGMYYLARRPEQAEPLLLQALGIMEASLGQIHPALVEPLEYLARVRLMAGRPAEAVSALERARDILRAAGKRPGQRQEVEQLLDQARREADRR